MDIFEEIAKRFLLKEAPKSLVYKRFGKESWNLDKDEKIQFAIENCRRLRITYDDKKGGKGKNTRYLFPLVYGVTKNGKKAIRAFQTFGSTKRGVPKYKLFLFNNIGRVEVGNTKYTQYEQLLLDTGFNDSGDKSFSQIYSITPLARNFNSAYLKNQDVPIDAEPVQKNDIETEPTTKKTQKQQPTKVKQTKKPSVSIDKTPQTDYHSKIEAPDTEPVTKDQVGTNQPGTQMQKLNAPDTEPVTKGEIEKPEIDKNNDLTTSYNDMMQRMDNLYKDDEEKNEE
jgi:hypothetical protein